MHNSVTQISTFDGLIGERYRLVQFINGGGMGRVYRAEDTRLANKIVAVKILIQSLAGNEGTVQQLRQRFEEEAQLSAVLSGHPRIIQVTDYGVDKNQPYLVMEYLGHPPQSQSLHDLIRQEQPLEAQRVVRLAIQICDALHYAHSFQTTLGTREITGVVHRDIKPSNIFILQDPTLGETVKILDFGIAKAISDVSLALGTNLGFVGSTEYASPEQLRGEVLDARSDIYSLGMVLYQMLTGQLPLKPETQSFPGWYQVHNFKAPQSFQELNLPQPVPPGLAQVILSCLAKDREQRPSSMQVLRERLETAINTPIQALANVPRQTATTKILPVIRKKSTGGWILVATVILAVLAGLSVPFLLPSKKVTPSMEPKSDPAPTTTVTAPLVPKPQPEGVNPVPAVPKPSISTPSTTKVDPDPVPAAPTSTPTKTRQSKAQERKTQRKQTSRGAADCYNSAAKARDYRCRNRKN